MYKKSGHSRSIFKILQVLSILQCLSSLQVGIYLSGHIRQKNQNSFETFNETISKNGQLMNLDIFLTLNNGAQKTIQYQDAPNFDTTQPMYLAVCPQNVDLTNISKMKDLTSKGCKIDQNSSMYYNINQEGVVSYQKSQTAQRYVFGGIKYAMGQISSELCQYPQKQFRFKNMIKNQLASIYKEEDLENNAKYMIQVQTIADMDIQYMNLKQISTGQKDDVFCYIDINSDQDVQIDSLQFKNLSDGNILVAQLQQNVNAIQPSSEPIQQRPLIVKVIENMGMVMDQSLYQFDQNESTNFQIQFLFLNDQMAVFIEQDLTNNLQPIIKTEEPSGFQSFMNAVDFTKKSGFMKLSSFGKKDIEMQVLACSGFLFPETGGNLLNELSLMGCENIKTINGILTSQGNSKTQDLKNRINSQASGDELKVKDFQLQSIQIEDKNDVHRIQIVNFIQHCDLLYDTILGVLFILCYMQYALVGNFMNLEEKLTMFQSKRTFTTEQLTENKLQTPRLEEFKFESRRNLFVNKNDVSNKWGKVQSACSKEDCAECMCVCFVECIGLCFIIILYLMCFLCILACEVICSRRVLTGNGNDTALKQNLLLSFKEYSGLVNTIQSQNQISYEQLDQILEQSNYFKSSTQQLDQTILKVLSSIPKEVPETVQIGNESVNLANESQQIQQLTNEAKTNVLDVQSSNKKVII